MEGRGTSTCRHRTGAEEALAERWNKHLPSLEKRVKVDIANELPTQLPALADSLATNTTHVVRVDSSVALLSRNAHIPSSAGHPHQ
jgi:hypothetical protein